MLSAFGPRFSFANCLTGNWEKTLWLRQRILQGYRSALLSRTTKYHFPDVNVDLEMFGFALE